jgi:hypothetical protein
MFSTQARQRILDLSANTQQNETTGTTKDSCLFLVSRCLRLPAAAHPWRKDIMGATLIGLVLGTLTGSVCLSTLTANEKVLTLTSGLDTWDRRELKEATDIIRDLQHENSFEEMLGGTLFLPGASKSGEAARTTISGNDNFFLR